MSSAIDEGMDRRKANASINLKKYERSNFTGVKGHRGVSILYPY